FCRPDVAWVGVDPQNHVVQAASVERRTDFLLGGPRGRFGCMQQLQGLEVNLYKKTSGLQRELSVKTAAGRSQGTVGAEPDVLVARDHSHDLLLQNLATV
ncbi:hypothetical protein KI387_041602, partial [Taxus chinensis]